MTPDPFQLCPLCGAMVPYPPMDDWQNRVVMLAVRLAIEGAAIELENRGYGEASNVIRGYDPDAATHGPGGPTW